MSRCERPASRGWTTSTEDVKFFFSDVVRGKSIYCMDETWRPWQMKQGIVQKMSVHGMEVAEAVMHHAKMHGPSALNANLRAVNAPEE